MSQTIVWEEGPEHRPRADLHFPPLHFKVEVLLDDAGEYGPLEDDEEFQLVLKVTCEVWDIDAYDITITTETRVLGPELGPEGGTMLSSLALTIIDEMRMSAHKQVRGDLTKAEARVMLLRAIEHRLTRPTLTAGDKRIVLTPDLARTVLALKDRAAQRPYRMELEAPNLVACYNEHNILLGRIIFRPNPTSGELGLNVYEPPTDIMRLFTQEAQIHE